MIIGKSWWFSKERIEQYQMLKCSFGGFNSSWVNKIGKKNFCICSRLLFKFSQFIGIDEVIGDHMELKSFSNDFFRLQDDDREWLFEVSWLVILTMLLRHFSSLTTAFRCFYKIWSGLEVDKLLHLWTMLLNSSLEKDIYINISFNGISSKTSRFICQLWAELNV